MGRDCSHSATRRVIGLKCVVRGFYFGRPERRRSSQARGAPLGDRSLVTTQSERREARLRVR